MPDWTPTSLWWWPHPADGGLVPDYPPVDLTAYLAGATPACGATNETLGLCCNREPHEPGTAHYQDNGGTVRAWPNPKPED